MRIPSLEGRDRKLDRAAIAAVFVFVATFSVVGIATAQMVATTSSIRIAPTTTDVLPEVAMDDNGDFLVVWRDLSRDMSMEPGPAHTDIFARRYDATGTALGKQFVVNNYTTGNQSEPEVVFIPGSNAGAASGSFAVVWSGTDSEYGGIFGNIVNGDDSLLLSMDIPLTSEADSQSAPSVAASDSGFVVVWSENYLTGGSSIRGRSFGLNGIPVGLDTLLVPGGDRASPEVALAPNGDFVVAYSFFQYLPMFQSHEDIRAQRFDSFFVAQGTEILVNDLAAQRKARANDRPRKFPCRTRFRCSSRCDSTSRWPATGGSRPCMRPSTAALVRASMVCCSTTPATSSTRTHSTSIATTSSCTIPKQRR
jgi:hypothetical protein